MPTATLRLAVLSIAAATLGVTAPSIAVADPDVFDLPAGIACADFDLRLEITFNPDRPSKTFFDKNGDPVRLFTGGVGHEVTLINLNTGARLELKPNGAVEHVRLNGSTQTWSVKGHNVLILFPTDVPAGPSTTLYVGRVVYTVDENGVFTLQSTSGKAMDICAALSG